ncbi:MAG TPA: tetratricopeptide repeat protein [Nitrospirota bacterium]|nr:tetratricopeptide repeat protein [Nitrospirota bacterium]
MKNITSIMTILVLLFSVVGCQQHKEEKSQTSYVPQTGPSPLEMNQLEQATKTSPKSKEVWINFGNSLMDTQRYSEAIEAYQKALALDPKNVSVRVDLGTCYRGVRNFDKAVEEYRKALKIDPNFPNGHRNLGVVLANDLHKPKDAVKEFQKYLEIMPNAPDANEIKQTIKQLSVLK